MQRCRPRWRRCRRSRRRWRPSRWHCRRHPRRAGPGPRSGPSARPGRRGGGPDLLAQLKQLAQLKDAGVLNEEEFQAAKAKLLAS